MYKKREIYIIEPFSIWTSNSEEFINLRYCLAGIEDLCSKRDDLHKHIIEEEEEKRKIQNDIRILTERLAKINESLSKKMASRNEFDRTIAETESAYMKVRSLTEILRQYIRLITKVSCIHYEF